jgi:DNA-binding Lrp family transcriptional regulator
MSVYPPETGAGRLMGYLMAVAGDGFWVLGQKVGEIARNVGLSRQGFYNALRRLQKDKYIVYFARNGSHMGVKIRLLRHRRVFRDLSTHTPKDLRIYKTYIKNQALPCATQSQIELQKDFNLGKSRKTINDYLARPELAAKVRIEKHWRFYREFMTQTRVLLSSIFPESISNICEGVIGELAHGGTLYHANKLVVNVKKHAKEILRKAKRVTGKALWLFIRIVALGKLKPNKPKKPQPVQTVQDLRRCRVCGSPVKDGEINGVCWPCYDAHKAEMARNPILGPDGNPLSPKTDLGKALMSIAARIGAPPPELMDEFIEAMGE